MSHCHGLKRKIVIGMWGLYFVFIWPGSNKAGDKKIEYVTINNLNCFVFFEKLKYLDINFIYGIKAPKF